jgi:superfamily II DNA/RNA helicase
VSFEALQLDAALVKAIAEAGYTTPTPIQAAAIPSAIAGRDLMASAQTGTGKTAAFILPSLQRLLTPATVKSRGPRVLVLAPTRELATQVKEAAEKYGRNLPRLSVVSVLGGMPYGAQLKLLSRPVDVLVATPGRLIDHIERGRIDFSRLEVVILDEADRMLDMGFLEDVERIVSATPATRQTLMFSATFDGPIATLAKRLLKNPERIQTVSQTTRHEHIEQRLHYVDDRAHKNRLLMHLLDDAAIGQALVFTATKRDADDLADAIRARGHATAALHGDMQQRQRNSTLTAVRRGAVRVLVATDVAARGIDVAGISHVINYDLPRSAEDYVHRIGRTGRAGVAGIAVSFANPDDSFILKRIERYTGQSIQSHIVEGMEPTRRPRPAHAPRKKPGGYRGNREFGARNGSSDNRRAGGNAGKPRNSPRYN